MIRSTEVDLRQFGMVVALVVIWIGLGIANPKILDPVNFLTFSVQAAGIAVLATGMVLVIVSRNIDLSVGSVVGFIGMFYAEFMAHYLPETIGFPLNHPLVLGHRAGRRRPDRDRDRRVPGLPDRLRRRFRRSSSP